MRDDLYNPQRTSVDQESVRKKHYYRIGLLLLACMIFFLAGQANNDTQPEESVQSENTMTENTTGGNQEMTYEQIDMEEAKELMESETGYIILDARTREEYATGHIPGAICIPNESIGTELPAELPEKNQLILVYCRSGNRSKQAARKLATLGYTNIKEFGGIMDWDGDIEQ